MLTTTKSSWILSTISVANSVSQHFTSCLEVNTDGPLKFLQHPIDFETKRGLTGSSSMPLAILYNHVLKHMFESSQNSKQVISYLLSNKKHTRFYLQIFVVIPLRKILQLAPLL